jgi:hypothetical protein
MSKGLGERQREILAVLTASDGPMLSMDLTSAIWAGAAQGGTPSASFYESTRRAAAALVKRGVICSGSPLARNSRPAKSAYWLPGQAAPELMVSIPAAVIEQRILDSLVDFDRPYINLVKLLGPELADHSDPRVPIRRAIQRLLKGGKVAWFKKECRFPVYRLGLVE